MMVSTSQSVSTGLVEESLQDLLNQPLTPKVFLL